MTTARDVIAEWLMDWNVARSTNSACDIADSLMDRLVEAPESVRLELAAKLNPWRPIETAPKDGTRILVHTTRKGIPRAEVLYWHQPGNPAAAGFWTAAIRPTHCFLLPARHPEDNLRP